jgi:hypothetical protein
VKRKNEGTQMQHIIGKELLKRSLLNTFGEGCQRKVLKFKKTNDIISTFWKFATVLPADIK